MDVAPTLSWRSYRESIGDRSPMFAAIASTWDVGNALYPGCYLDLSPSTAIDAVTYVDTDRRAASYFADSDLVRRELAGASARGAVEFLRADYTRPLPVSERAREVAIRSRLRLLLSRRRSRARIHP